MSEDNIKELKEIKKLIQGTMTGYHARIEAKYEIIDIKLDGINNHLDKLNSKVEKHEKRITKIESDKLVLDEKNKTRELSCPHLDRINNLETENVTKKKLLKYGVGVISLLSLLLGIVLTIERISLF